MQQNQQYNKNIVETDMCNYVCRRGTILYIVANHWYEVLSVRAQWQHFRWIKAAVNDEETHSITSLATFSSTLSDLAKTN